MIVTAILDGFSTSSRPFRYRLHPIILWALQDTEHVALAKRALFAPHRARTMRRFIAKHDNYENTLLVCGKSLGGKIMIDDVINKMPRLSYKKLFILIVDANWPTCKDWTPNLNHKLLHINRPFDHAINVMNIATTPHQQAGAMIVGPCGYKLENRMIKGWSHKTIVDSPQITAAVEELIEESQPHNTEDL